jgi:hypothetical protein
MDDHVERLDSAGAKVLSQQELECHRLRELRRSTEPTVHAIVLVGERTVRAVEELDAGLARARALGAPGECRHQVIPALEHLIAAILVRVRCGT